MGSPLKIVIAGGGLGGLAAACRLAQDGHHVHLLERSDALKTTGGGIYIQSAAVRCLERWALMSSLTQVTTTIARSQFRNGYTDEVQARQQASRYSDVPSLASDRQAIQGVFFDYAQKAGVGIRFGNAAVQVEENPDHATVTCENGQVLHCDLFLAADGINSRLRAKILSSEHSPVAPVPAISTHYPAKIPRPILEANELTKPLVCEPDANDSHVFTGKHCYVVLKYNHSRELLNIMWSIQHGQDSDEARNPRLYDEDGDPGLVRKYFSDFHPIVRTLAAMTTSCSRWRLARLLPPLQTWSSQGCRLVLLGDSAHAMLPNIAQGFSSIVEDIEALAILLDRTPTLQDAVRLWQNIRVPRVNKFHATSEWNYDCYNGGSSPKVHMGEVQKDLPPGSGDVNAPMNSTQFWRWVHQYDVAAAIDQLLGSKSNL